ncbi:MAG: growth/differentiation factor [Salinibacterium sp.]|nr:hypothetical protein [Salinibacterium sp.]MBF0672556.1 growth/differentiation factor [Salinibacterium sp.]
MMLEFLLDPASLVPPVFTEYYSDEDDDGSILPLLLLLSGPAFAVFVYLRYRNTDKRHRHEVETHATLHDVRAVDTKVRSLSNLSNSRMKGANHTEVRANRRSIF